jgi:hypothetical protein
MDLLFGAALAASISGLRPGATVRLPAGEHDRIVIRNRSFDPPATIVATGATLKGGLSLENVSGIRWKGGTIRAPEGFKPSRPPLGYALRTRNARDIVIEDVRLTDAVRGAVIGESRQIVMRRVRAEGLRSDGINIAQSNDILIEDIVCRDFRPIPKTRDANGKVVKDGDHPDCVQSWSKKGATANSDIVVRRVTARGDMQGIFFGTGANGGFDRVKFEDNDIEVTYGNGIFLQNGRGAIVRRNRVVPVAGARHQSTMRLQGRDIIACDNKVAFGQKRGEVNRRCSADEARAVLSDPPDGARLAAR